MSLIECDACSRSGGCVDVCMKAPMKASVAASPPKLTPRQAEMVRLLKSAGGRMSYHSLAMAMWPHEEYPRAWRYSSNGGPPGCYMQLSAMIRRLSLGRYKDEVSLPAKYRECK